MKWKLVPADVVTGEMVAAGIATPVANTGNDDVDRPEDYKQVFLSMLEAAPPAPSVPDAALVREAERWLSQRDLELLVTFGMQADDCDADGHTLSKEQTRRLCELGVLRNVGFGRSEMTAFGCVLFDQHWEQSRSLPLRTHAEYAALAAEKGGAA